MKGLFRGVWVPLREAGRVKSHYHFRPERALEGNDMILETHESWNHGKETSRQALYLKKHCMAKFLA